MVNAKHQYTDAWRWPESVRDRIREHSHGRVANICCGQSDIGDVTVDADPEHDPDVVSDMRNLPFEPCSFDTVVSDPPWKMGFYKRMKPFFECVRILKPGGTLLYNVPYHVTSQQLVLVDSWDRWDVDFGQVSKIWKFEKRTDMPDCNECDITKRSLESLKNHFQEEHGGEVWTPEEYLGAPDSDQKDLEGEDPDDSEHDPEYLGDTEKPDSEKTRLEDYAE